MSKDSLEPQKRPKVTRRRAGGEDVPALADVARACFPDDVTWQVRRTSHAYWKLAVACPSVEVWLWSVEETVAGFSVIVVDLAGWVEARRSRRRDVATRALALVAHPRLMLRKLDAAARLLFSRNGASDAETGRAHEFPPVESGHPSSALVNYGGIQCDPAGLAWAEFLGVHPSHRKLGLALDIIRFNESRARALHCTAIALAVETQRETWCWMHERLHYLRVLTIRTGRESRNTYVKILDPNRSEIRSRRQPGSAAHELVVVTVP